ncbi:MAG: hypothetical protein JXQ67_09605 [Campylobacterales bacterium]|nr:hypothetical protein [Campylobacterales bacterium]
MQSGMIFQYDRSEQNGLLMLTNGEKKEFNIDNWVDALNEPFVGQKISYEFVSGKAQIWVEGSQRLELQESAVEVDEDEIDLGDVDDHITYYISMGFNLVKDSMENGSRIVNLRYYRNGEFGEATIKENNGVISLTQSMNGQTIVNR